MLTKKEVEVDRADAERIVTQICKTRVEPQVRGDAKRLRAIIWDLCDSLEELREALEKRTRELAGCSCQRPFHVDLKSGVLYQNCPEQHIPEPNWCGSCKAKKEVEGWDE